MKATEGILTAFANWWNAKKPFLLLLSFIMQHHDTWLPLLMLRNLIVLHVATNQQWLQIGCDALMFYISHSHRNVTFTPFWDSFLVMNGMLQFVCRNKIPEGASGSASGIGFPIVLLRITVGYSQLCQVWEDTLEQADRARGARGAGRRQQALKSGQWHDQRKRIQNTLIRDSGLKPSISSLIIPCCQQIPGEIHQSTRQVETFS